MIMPIDNILREIIKSQAGKKTCIIAVDGHGGSGKSLLVNELISRHAAVTVVHSDDFYNPNMKFNTDTILPKFDWQRLEKEVLSPIYKNHNSKYRRFNWHTEKLDDWINISNSGIIIIEGVCSMKSELLEYYNYKIWIDCPIQIRLARAKARDGDRMADKWLYEWIPAENNYIKSEKPYLSADLIIDGSGLNADIEKGNIFVLNIGDIEPAK